MSNVYYSNKNPNSNFDGDWAAACIYCGRPHKEHMLKDRSSRKVAKKS